MEPQWLTVEEAMGYLKTSRSTLYRWMESGLLPYYEFPPAAGQLPGGRRFKREDLDALLRQGLPKGELVRRPPEDVEPRLDEPNQP